jgi:uncharacterized protein (UPF0335 family)
MRAGSGLSLAVREDPEEAFRRFIVGSTVIGEAMSGTDGLALRYHNPIDVYRSSDKDTFDQQVHTILIKFVSIKGIKDKNKYLDEVQTQRDIYNKTNDSLEPLCPAIIFNKACELSDPLLIELNFFDNLAKYIEDRKAVFEDEGEEDEGKMPDFLSVEVEHIGVIAMEFLDDYQNMHDLIYTGVTSEFTAAAYMAAAFLLIELALLTGYTQGDYHMLNIFFKVLPENAENPYFLTDGSLPEPIQLIRRLKPIIIDFGRAIKIRGFSDVAICYKKHKFKQILGLIAREGCYYNGLHDVYGILEFPTTYSWASGSEVVIKDTKLFGEYENKIINDKLFFFNFKTVLTRHEISNLNFDFNGEGGLMQKIITAREKAKNNIADFAKSNPRLAIYVSDLPISIKTIEEETKNEGYIPKTVSDVIKFRKKGGKRKTVKLAKLKKYIS